MNPVTLLDTSILAGLNAFARKSWAFDHAVSSLADNNLLKGGVIVALLWWAWFRTDQGGTTSDRAHVLATILGCLVALAVARLLVLTLPFCVRPLHDSHLAFVAPYGVTDISLAKASSFPSDHAVFFFALATGFFFISRRAAIAVTLYTVVAIALPRMYLGLHYFSDIAAGAAIGAFICWVANRWLPATRGLQWAQKMSLAKPMYFYPLLFLVTYQFAELFDGSRAIASEILKILR